MKKLLNIIFIIIAVLTMLEFFFISGMFTGPIMMVLIVIIGIANTVYSITQKETNESILYLICTISLCLGYLKIMV